MSEYKIIRLGHQGDGIAEGPVFVPLALPGEVVTGTRDGDTLRDVKIVTPSDQRVSARCKHFKTCGGCYLQHAADDFVADFKVHVVKTALQAHGLETTFRPIATSPERSRRRATFSVKRTKKGAQVGFHARGSDQVIDITDCVVAHPDLIAARPLMVELAKIGGTRKGALSVTVTRSIEGLDVSVANGKPLDTQIQMDLAGIPEGFKIARLTWDGEVIGQREPPTHAFGAARVVPPPGAFLQATEHGQNALLDAVREVAGDGARGVDLFAGCGTFTLPLASNAEMHGVEGDAAMMASLDAGWRKAQGLKKVVSETRDLFRRPLLPDELAKFDFAVIDPPRAGAEAQITELVTSKIAKIAYVSCSPATFARDAATLSAGGFKLDWIQVVDQFRWSPHVELAASFTRTNIGARY